MEAVWISAAVVFVAEFGDKSQLLAMTFAARARTGLVLAGMVCASIVTQGLAALAGDLLGGVVAGPVVGLGAAALFVVFAVLTLRGGDDAEEPGDDDGTGRDTGGPARVVAGVAAATFVAEIGDKTMLATLALAAREGFLPVWIGASFGMAVAASLGVLAGHHLRRRLPDRTLRLGSAGMFLLVGAWLAFDAVLG